MGFIAEALFLIKRNNFSSAAKLLQYHVNDAGLKPASRIGIMAWIGECYLKAENLESAANWFERAGNTALACRYIPQTEREKRAKSEFEQAINYYGAIDNIKGMARVAAIKYSLNSETI